MATRSLAELIHRLCGAALLRDKAGWSDGQLLDDYLARRDELALGLLVHRHGYVLHKFSTSFSCWRRWPLFIPLASALALCLYF